MQQLVSLDSLFWVHIEYFGQEHFGEGRVIGHRSVHLPRHKQIEKCLEVYSVEWLVPDEHLVEDDTDRPTVTLERVLGVCECLRAHVDGRAYSVEAFCEVVSDKLSEAKIPKFCDVGVLKQNIGGLDISVDDILGVDVVDSPGNLGNEEERLILGEFA